MLLWMGSLNTLTTWGQSCSILIRFFFYLAICELVCVHACVFAVCAWDARMGCDQPLFLNVCFRSPTVDSLCLCKHTDPHEISEVCLWDPDRGWGGRCCEDPIRHLCQTLHLPGSPGWGHATGPHWQLPQQPAAASVGLICVCVCVNVGGGKSIYLICITNSCASQFSCFK